MENSMEAKQQYLREKIIDAGYDPESFVEYCSEKHNLDDLENWSMQELTDIVSSFIRSLPSPSLNPTPKHQQAAHKPADNTESTTLENNSKNRVELVFSDDDWNVLANPSVISPLANSFVNIPLQLNLLHVNNNALKDFPLSPPSVNTTKMSQQDSKPQPQKQQQPLKITQPNTQTISKDKTSKLINLSHIKIKTSKEKAFAPAPEITEVKVIKTEQIPRSFFQSGYTLYHIQFSPSQHVIQRKFTDLNKARNGLQRLYPFLRLPYLEPEGWISTSEGKDPQTQIKYRLMVGQFMRYVAVQSEELRNTQIVRILCDFPVINKPPISREDLKQKLQSLEHVTRPKFLGDIVLANNTIDIPPVGSNEKEISNTMHMLSEIDLIYEKLKKQMQALFQNYDLLIQSLGDVSSTFQTLQNTVKKYNSGPNQDGERKVYEGLKQMARKFSKRIDQEYEIFQSTIKNLFRYERDNMNTLKQVIECRNKIHNEYVRRGQPTLSSSLKTQGSIVEVESSAINLEQPVCNNKNTLAVQQAFWSFMSSRQIARYWTHLRARVTEHLTLIAQQNLLGENQNLNFWNSIIKQCIL